MCIFISSIAHPDYSLIILSNRDEYFARPTQLATVRNLPNGSQILSPLDLGRKEHGTWIGVTSLGKLAALVNYSEQETLNEISRGILPIKYLTSELDDDTWYNSLEETLAQEVAAGKQSVLNRIGGFTLVYGKLEVDPASKNIKPLNIISNRGDRGKIHAVHDVSCDNPHQKFAVQSTFSLSNSLYYEPWLKVRLACSGLSKLIKVSVDSGYSREQLMEGCFEVLSQNTFSYKASKNDMRSELQNSIFIPPVEYSDDPNVHMLYGTRTQTVILLHKSGILHYCERDLHSHNSADIAVKSQDFALDLNKRDPPYFS